MDEPIKILLCEDEENLGNILQELLESKRFAVTLCTDGDQGWEAFKNEKFDLCLLDIMMPKRDGLTLAKDIRSLSTDVPIIFLTALGMRENILEGFRSGADDYITKPFSMEELLLRIEAILRRTTKHEGDKEPQRVYQLGNYVFNTTTQTLSLGDQSRRLTTKERGHALNVIWGISETSGSNDGSFSQRSMDVYVTKLRRMLVGDDRVEIKNVHGKGYKLVIPPIE